jgi:TM2 domain-containing membrane protein YozV
MSNPSTHSLAVGRILWFFGFTGAHRFYFGKRKSGLLMAFLTLIGPFTFFIPAILMWVVDLFLLPSMDRQADGRYVAGRLDYSVAWILITFLGAFGAHRFYQGKTITGILFLLTVGFFLIGWFYDFWTLNQQISDSNQRLKS